MKIYYHREVKARTGIILLFEILPNKEAFFVKAVNDVSNRYEWLKSQRTQAINLSNLNEYRTLKPKKLP